MHVCLLDLEWVGHHTVFAARRSRALVDLGHEVTFITSRDHARLDLFPDTGSFSVKRVSPPPFRGLLEDRTIPGKTTMFTSIQYCRAIAKARESGADLLHVLHLNPDELPLWIASRGSLPVPVVATIHRDHYELGLKLDVVNRWGFRRCLRDGTLRRVFVNVETQSERIKRLIPEAHDGNVETIPLATPRPPGGLTRRGARDHLDLPTDVPLLLFFAGHRYEQGPDILLEAVRDFDTPVGIVFAGPSGYVTGDDLESFREVDDGAARVIDRIGWVPEEDIYPYFVAVDVAVMPFRRSRGVSETLNRACLTDTHPIASDDSDIGYLVDRHDLGQTFERGSVSALRAAIRTYLDHREDYPKPTIREYGESQLTERVGERLETAYHEVLAQPQEGSATSLQRCQPY